MGRSRLTGARLVLGALIPGTAFAAKAALGTRYT